MRRVFRSREGGRLATLFTGVFIQRPDIFRPGYLISDFFYRSVAVCLEIASNISLVVMLNNYRIFP
jgi:hypothetical protein